jgi:hypothetical protein
MRKMNRGGYEDDGGEDDDDEGDKDENDDGYCSQL